MLVLAAPQITLNLKELRELKLKLKEGCGLAAAGTHTTIIAAKIRTIHCSCILYMLQVRTVTAKEAAALLQQQPAGYVLVDVRNIDEQQVQLAESAEATLLGSADAASSSHTRAACTLSCGSSLNCLFCLLP